MKKLYFLAMAIFLSLSLNAQLTDGFESYPDGPYYGGHWTNWSGASGSENINVVSTKAFEGTKSGYVGGNELQDPILNVGMKTSGTWTLSMQLFIDAGKSGYFNAQHDLGSLGQEGNWGYEVFFGIDPTQQGFPQNPGTCTYVVGGNGFTFPYREGQWFNFVVEHNLDNNTVRLFLDGQEITIQGTNIPFGSDPAFQGMLNGFDYFSASPSMSMYIDDVKFTEGALAVHDAVKSSVSVYPTVSSDYVTISAPNAISEVSVFSTEGRQVTKLTPNAAKTQVNVSTLPAGVYILKIQTGKEVLSKKIIVK